MNRKQRRADAAGRKKAGHVENYRVPEGRVAITFDVEGYDPSTFEIAETRLTALVAEIDVLVAGHPFEDVLHLLGRAYRRLKAGSDETSPAGALGWWLAFNHPYSGDQMRSAVSARMVRGEPVHVTVWAGAKGGIAFALSDGFADLAEACASAQAANLGVIIAAEPREPPVGQA